MIETLDVNEAADYLKVSVQTLANWRVEGEGPKHHKPKGRVIYYKDDLDNWIRGKDV